MALYVLKNNTQVETIINILGHCLLKIDIVIASGRYCVYRKKHSVSYLGLTMVSIKTIKNTNGLCKYVT